MSIFATGNNTQAYVGVRAQTPPNMNLINRNPTQKDWQNYVVGDFWLNPILQNTYILSSLAGNIANWDIIGAAHGDVVQLTADDGNTALPFAGNINIQGSTNINTTVSVPGSANLQINLNNDIRLPATNISGTAGVIYFGGFRFISSLDNTTVGATTNAFYGANSGSLMGALMGTGNTGIGSGSMSIITSGSNNTGVGYLALNSITSGIGNTAIGTEAGNSINTGNGNTFIGNDVASIATLAGNNTIIGSASGIALSSGFFNTGIGAACLSGLIDGLYNIAVGYTSGDLITHGDYNIDIGNSGGGGDNGIIRIGTNGNQTATYIVGIDGVNVGSVAKVVTESADQLGTATITAGSGISVVPTANTITISTSGAGTGILNYTLVNTTPYVVLPTDQFLGVDCSGGAIQIQLPNGTLTGRVINIKDKTGSAATFNITVRTVDGAVLIDGATTYVMNTAYESINVIFDGATYEVF